MFTAEQLLDDAVAATDLDDFGAPSFRTGLDVVVDGFTHEAQLNEIGEAAAQAMLTASLIVRLRLERYVAEHPGTVERPVAAPWVIIGTARSGTTALHHILSRDPALRSLRQWEVNDPVPPPTDETYWDDPRYLAAREAGDMVSGINPDFKAIHEDPPDMPIECVTSMAHEFVSLLLCTVFHLPTYLDWVLAADHEAVYRWHDRTLRVLGSRTSGRWQLKTPHHGAAIDSMVQQWPDARCIVTHREPAECVASTASLFNSLMGTFSDADHRAVNARCAVTVHDAIVNRTHRYRREHPDDDRFVDLAYRDLVADPVSAVEQLYAGLGAELSADARTAIAAHVGEHRQHRHGVHRYDFASLGLDEADVRSHFDDYRQTWGEYL